MSTKEEEEQAPWLAHLKRHSDPVSNQSDEEIMCDVSPEGTITNNVVHTCVKNFVTIGLHVKSCSV